MCEEEPVVMLMCVDGSTHSYEAFKFYKKTLHRPNHELVIFHVSEIIPLSTMEHQGAFGWKHSISIDQDVLQAKLQTIKEANEALGEGYSKDCVEANISHKVVTVPGDHGPEQAIMDYIHHNKVSGVIMGTRGLGKIKRTFMGSVSHHVLHHSHVPVTVCPPKKTKPSN